MEKILGYIDGISKWTAAVGVWMIVALSITVFYDVIMRYAFNAPTFWAYETSWMFYSVNFLLGLGYALQKGAHTTVDILINRFNNKVKLIVEILFLIVMLVFCIIVIWHGSFYAISSWKLREGSHLTLWAPPVYPIKTLIPFSFFVLGLQSIAEIIRKVRSLVIINEERKKL